MGGRATILGAAGFVGARLKARLQADGWDVFAPAKGDPAVLASDLGVLFYCAGLTADYDQRPFDTVEAHASLVSEVARAGRFDRLIYTSSTRLYDGLSSASASVDEGAPLSFDPANPRHVYDLSKALGENLTLARTDGRGSVARLSNVFDWEDGSPGFLSEWLIRARTGRVFALDSSPHVARDYIHVDDVVSALVAMAAAPAPGIVNVSAGALSTNGEIAQVFADCGWDVSFTRDGRPASPPNAEAGKLIGLGVTPRPVKDVVRGYLKGLGA